MKSHGKKIHILIFNKNSSETEQICAEVEKIDLSIEIHTAKNPKEYIKKVLKFEPSVVIISQLPGDYSPFEAYQDLRRALPLAFFILIVSEYNDAEMRNYSLSGIDAFLPKGDYSLLKLIILQGFNRKDLEKTQLQSNQAMIERQQRLRSFFNNAMNSIFIVNFKNEILDMNPAAIALIGSKKVDEIIGSTISKYFSKPDQKKIRSGNAAAFRGKKSSDEMTLALARGKGKQLLVNFAPVKNEDGVVVSVMLICKDISETTLLKEKFKLSEERFITLAEHAPVGIYYTDAESNCVFINRKWTEYTGMTTQAALGKGWMKAVHPDDKANVIGQLEKLKHENTNYVIEFRVIHTSGKIFRLKGESTAFLDQNGEQQGYVGTLWEISERESAAETSGDTRQNILLG